MIPKMVRSSYLRLPSDFYQCINPKPISSPRLIKLNHPLLSTFESQEVNQDEAVALYAGNSVPGHLQSIALAYAGHQFGYYVPLLGDGRALIIGEILDKNGQHWDFQLKGSGRTHYSRSGDGRAPLSAVLREYLMSEAMHGLGIPTTRALAAVESEETIYRQEGLVPLGVLTRIASSYLRVGSFQYAAFQKDNNLLHDLTRYAINRHFPSLEQHESPYLALFEVVMDRQAKLIADWMAVGFIHGVMNTDNMSILGETIDYGPCAFIDEFDLNAVFSSIDVHGRYSFGNQLAIAAWNLERFADSLSSLMDKKSQQLLYDKLHVFPSSFTEYWNKKLHAKLGFFDINTETLKLSHRFMQLLQQHKPDFTNTFQLLSASLSSPESKITLLRSLGNHTLSNQWLDDWTLYIKKQHKNVIEFMASVNPVYIPRNHLINKAIQTYIENRDDTLINTLLDLWADPYKLKELTAEFQRPPLAHERITATFCGT